MPQISKQPANNFREYVALFETLREKAKEPLWYRGVGNMTYKLTPSLFRHCRSKSIEDYLSLESDLLSRFKQRSIPFQTRPMTDEWDLLFFMQHFGVPTRLLDWSESPLMALFFAVTSAPHSLNDKGKPVFSADAAIWVLDPFQWNKRAVRRIEILTQRFGNFPL